MTVERVATLTNVAITYTDSLGQPAFLIPIVHPDGTRSTLAEDGPSTFDSGDSCRAFIADWQADPECQGDNATDADRECWAAYEALAQLFDDFDRAQAGA